MIELNYVMFIAEAFVFEFAQLFSDRYAVELVDEKLTHVVLHLDLAAAERGHGRYRARLRHENRLQIRFGLGVIQSALALGRIQFRIVVVIVRTVLFYRHRLFLLI